MTDERLELRLRATYASRGADDASSQLVRRVLAIPATSSQRRGWLPRLDIGGTQTMFSATRMVAAVAVIALSGSVLLVGLPQKADAPAAAVTQPALMSRPAHVAGTVVATEGAGATIATEGEVTALGDQFFRIEGAGGEVQWEANDPRLSGQGTMTENGFQHFDTYTGIYATRWTITNDDGSWAGTGDHFSSPSGGRDFIVLTGAGAYDGLTAYVSIGNELTPDVETSSRRFDGVIFPGDMPTIPELLPLE